MKKVILTLAFPFILCMQFSTFGQELRPVSQIRFSLGINGYQPLRIENTGEKLVKSTPMPAPSGQMTFHQEIYHGFGINIGYGLEFDPFRLGYKFPTPENSIVYGGPTDAGFDAFLNIWIHQGMYTVPIGIEKEFRGKSKINTLELGFKFNKLLTYPYHIGQYDFYETINGDLVLVYKYSQFETKRNFITYYLKVGLMELCKNKKLKLNMVVQYSPDAIGTGSYEFRYLGFESYGTTKQRNNYIGIELTYGLTLIKK